MSCFRRVLNFSTGLFELCIKWLEGARYDEDSVSPSPSSNERNGHLTRFMLHSVVFAPAIIIAIAAVCMFAKLHGLLLFAIFAANTLALETCINCTLKRFEELAVFGKLSRNAYRKELHELGDALGRRADVARSHASRFAFLTALTGLSWVLVTVCEVLHLVGQEPPGPLMLVSAAFSVVNLSLSVAKLWIVTKEETEGRLAHLLFTHLLPAVVFEGHAENDDPREFA